MHRSAWRACLENSLRVLDGLCLVLQEGEMGDFRPVLATRYTPNLGPFGLSRESLEGRFCELRPNGVLRRSPLRDSHRAYIDWATWRLRLACHA